MFKYLLNICVFLSCTLVAEWQTVQEKVGNESFSIAFPETPTEKNQEGNFTLFAHEDAKALYILTASNPPLVQDPQKAIQTLIMFHATGPRKTLSSSVSKEGENTFLDIESVDTNSQIRTYEHYVFTPQNIWKLKTVYDNPEDHQHEKFIRSFELK